MGVFFEKLKDHSYNAQNRMSDKIPNSLFDKYKNTVMLHLKHMFQTKFDMATATMCAYPPLKYAFSTLEMCFMLSCTMSKD